MSQGHGEPYTAQKPEHSKMLRHRLDKSKNSGGQDQGLPGAFRNPLGAFNTNANDNNLESAGIKAEQMQKAHFECFYTF